MVMVDLLCLYFRAAIRLSLSSLLCFYRILFESLVDPYQATGVLVNYKGRLIDIRAKKEVILSSGTIGSPHLLMLSGVGPAQHLRDFDVSYF